MIKIAAGIFMIWAMTLSPHDSYHNITDLGTQAIYLKHAAVHWAGVVLIILGISNLNK